MKTAEIIKRTFEAAGHPKDSLKRKELNLKSETSEYMHGSKYIARVHYPETATNLAYKFDRSFRTKTEAQQWIDKKLQEV